MGIPRWAPAHTPIEQGRAALIPVGGAPGTSSVLGASAIRLDKIEVTPEMIEAGEYVLTDFGSPEEFEATSPALIVREIFSAMLRASSH